MLESPLGQSGHLTLGLKVSMACWLIADQAATRDKVQAAHAAGVAATTGGGPYEVALAQGQLRADLDLCAEIGFDGIECGAGFIDSGIPPTDVLRMASEHGLGVDSSSASSTAASSSPMRWLSWWTRLADGSPRRALADRRGARERRRCRAVRRLGHLGHGRGERITNAFGLELLIFEAPTTGGLHSDAFGNPKLPPRRVALTAQQ